MRDAMAPASDGACVLQGREGIAPPRPRPERHSSSNRRRAASSGLHLWCPDTDLEEELRLTRLLERKMDRKKEAEDRTVGVGGWAPDQQAHERGRSTRAMEGKHTKHEPSDLDE